MCVGVSAVHASRAAGWRLLLRAPGAAGAAEAAEAAAALRRGSMYDGTTPLPRAEEATDEASEAGGAALALLLPL